MADDLTNAPFDGMHLHDYNFVKVPNIETEHYDIYYLKPADRYFLVTPNSLIVEKELSKLDLCKIIIEDAKVNVDLSKLRLNDDV